MARAGIVHLTTVVYRPQANGKAERMVKTAKEALRAVKPTEGLTWRDVAKAVQFGLNTAPRKARESAAKEVLGWQPNGPVEAAWTDEKGEAREGIERLDAVKARFAEAFEAAKQRYDSHRRPAPTYEDDTPLLVSKKALNDEVAPLGDAFAGPFDVVADEGGENVVLRIRGKNQRIHKESVKRFVKRAGEGAEEDEEGKEEKEYEVEAILDVREKRAKDRHGRVANRLQFLVKYKGYTTPSGGREQEDYWANAQDVTAPEAVKEFKRENLQRWTRHAGRLNQLLLTMERRAQLDK